MPKIRNLGKTIDRFNQSCSFLKRAVTAWKEENFQEYETMLVKAATYTIDALEWSLKIYLRNFCRDRITAEDAAKLKHPNFDELMDLMQKYADPQLEPETVDLLFDSRELRGAAEYELSDPPFQELYDAIQVTCRLIVAYLPVQESQLRRVVVPAQNEVPITSQAVHKETGGARGKSGMAKLIARRYELVQSQDSDAEEVDYYLALDHKSADEDLVQLRLFRMPKHTDLIHSTFMTRAKELSNHDHPGLVRLTDYGYDGANALYYLVYENVPGKRLSKFLEHARPPFDWCLDALFEICDALIHLHAHGISHGAPYPRKTLLNLQGELPIKLMDPGLNNIRALLSAQRGTNEKSAYEEGIQRDIIALGVVAAQLITRNPRPNQKDLEHALQFLPLAMKDFFRRFECTLDGRDGEYVSIAEAKRDLRRALSQHQANTVYYLGLTRTATTRLFEMGFIVKDEHYLAVNLLNDELKGEVYGRTVDTRHHERNTYYITTSRFRLVCVPDQNAPQSQLTVVTIECPSGTGMVFEREIGLSITASMQVTLGGKIPTNARITPLLDMLEEHRLQADRAKRAELAQKTNLDTWRKVLALQRRLLNQFQLPYVNWVLADEDAAIAVELKEELDTIDLSGDERLRMSAKDDRGSIVVGFFEELNGKLFKIGLARNVDVDSIAKRGKITLDNKQVESILYRQEDAFRRLKFGEAVNPRLLELLTEPTKLQIERTGDFQFWDQTLDPSQQDAVKHTLATKDIFLIQGPPGTGKTTAIVELVRQILHGENRVRRVLVASQSNVAVNHALLSLIERDLGLKDAVIRVGREEKAGETSDFLLDQQLLRWAEQVKAKSKAYIEQRRTDLEVDTQLAECLSIIDECQTKKLETVKLQEESKLLETEHSEAEAQLQQLQELMAQAQAFRQRASILLANVAEGDEAFHQLMDSFQKDYVSWGERFLSQADEAAHLSSQRAELKNQIDQLDQAHSELVGQISAGVSLVRETLHSLAGVDLPDLNSQRAYLNKRLSEQQASALKLGRLQKVAQDWQRRISKDTSDFVGEYLTRCRVVGATCIGVAAKGDISKAEFDWVIVDEAGRATHPELIVPLVRGHKLVLVGDHRQLPPIIDRDLESELLEEIGVRRQDLETSLFQEMMDNAGTKVKATLRIQYRMHPAIGNLISECFYDGQLQHGVGVADRQHGLSWCPTPVIWYSTHQLKHHEERKVGHSYQNIAEVEIILELLDKMESDLAKHDLQKKVGVITGYMAQKHLLRQRVATGDRWPHLLLEVNTVDAYQGREMDYIIYSVVRSNPAGQIGFLRDERRLNVALSRAQELLVIVGDRETTEFARTRGQDNPFFTVIRYIRQNPTECTLEDLAQ
jgi:superfamily I DNA and/or RNA helicase